MYRNEWKRIFSSIQLRATMAVQPPNIKTFLVLLHGILAIVPAGTSVCAFIETGAEIVALFLKTSYRWLPILAGCAAAASFLLNAGCGIYAASGKRPAGTASAASALAAGIVIWLTSYYTIDLVRRTKKMRPHDEKER